MVSLLQLVCGLTSVNLDKTQVHNVSACVGILEEHGGKQKPSRALPAELQRVEIVQKTIANNKK